MFTSNGKASPTHSGLTIEPAQLKAVPRHDAIDNLARKICRSLDVPEIGKK